MKCPTPCSKCLEVVELDSLYFYEKDYGLCDECNNARQYDEWRLGDMEMNWAGWPEEKEELQP